MNYQEKTECLANTETRGILTIHKIFSKDLKKEAQITKD